MGFALVLLEAVCLDLHYQVWKLNDAMCSANDYTFVSHEMPTCFGSLSNASLRRKVLQKYVLQHQT